MKIVERACVCMVLAVVALAASGTGRLRALSSDTELDYFRVNAVTEDGVELEWATSSEAGSLSFKIYRATSADGFRQVVYETPAAGGFGVQTSYIYFDYSPDEGSYWYWVADVNAQGVEQALTTPIKADYGVSGQGYPPPPADDLTPTPSPPPTDPSDQGPMGYQVYLPMLGRD